MVDAVADAWRRLFVKNPVGKRQPECRPDAERSPLWLMAES